MRLFGKEGDEFFELAARPAPVAPGGLAHTPFMRELISMLTPVNEAEWESRNDPSVLSSDSILGSMASRDSGFSKKLTLAVYPRLSTKIFIQTMSDMDLPTQELITNSIATYSEKVDLEDSAYNITALSVEILYAKAGLKDKTAEQPKTVRFQSAQAKYEDLLLVRYRGCTKCRTPLTAGSHDVSRGSFEIFFLDASDELDPDDFAVTCKPCAEKFNLAFTDEEVAELCRHDLALTASETADAGLAPLGLNSKIVEFLSVINQLPLDQAIPESSYDIVLLRHKLDDAVSLRTCRDTMASYAPKVRNEAKALESSGQFDFDLLRHQIRSAWFVTRTNGMTQYEIWRRLTERIDEKTNVDSYACGIVVAFLIQICDLLTPAMEVPA